MDKTLTRKLFQTTKHDHRSSGITSGLQYRTGYATGGRVGFRDGVGPNAALQRGDKLDPKEQALIALRSRTGPVDESAPVQNRVRMLSSNTPSQSAEDIFLKDRSLREKYLTPVDYSQYGRTGLDTLADASLNFLKKRQEVIPAGTVGSPNQFLDLGIAYGDARQTTAETNKALRLKQEEEEYNRTLGLLQNSEAQLEKFRSEGRADAAADQLAQIEILKLDLGNQQADARIQLGRDDLATRLQIALGEQANRIDLQEIANQAPSEIMKNYAFLIKEGGKTPEQALALAFKTQNSQLDFAASLLNSLSRGVMPDTTQAARQTFSVMQSMFGDSLNIDLQAIEDILKTQGAQGDKDIKDFNALFGDDGNPLPQQ